MISLRYFLLFLFLSIFLFDNLYDNSFYLTVLKATTATQPHLFIILFVDSSNDYQA